MNIIVLDAHTVNPGDLSWGPLEALGNVTLYPRTNLDEIIPRAKNADAILTNKVPISASTLLELPSLKYIGVLATGMDHIDVTAARARNIIVKNVENYSTYSVAQHTFALLLNITQGISQYSEGVRQGEWSRSSYFSYWHHTIPELHGKKFGIIGFGEIGQTVGRLAHAFGMSVLVHTPRPKAVNYPVNNVSLNELLWLSDVVSLHCPLTQETTKLINADRLRLMKPQSILLNTARGGLIDEAALANALNQKQLAGAGLDTLSKEPPPANNPLLTAKNCVITPHQAWATLAARKRLIQAAAEHLNGVRSIV